MLRSRPPVVPKSADGHGVLPEPLVQQVAAVVLHNDDLNEATWEQLAISGARTVEASQVPRDLAYVPSAELLGATGKRVADSTRAGRASDEALAADDPSLIEIIIDPEVPPLPPGSRVRQATVLPKVISHGEPVSREIIAQTNTREITEVVN